MTTRQELLFENVVPADPPARRRRGGFGPNDLLLYVEFTPLPLSQAEHRAKEYPLHPLHREALKQVYEAYRFSGKGFRLQATYYRYSGLTHTVRARGNQLHIRISHHFERQPPQVIQAIGHVLIRKLLRLPPRKTEATLCREVEASLAKGLADAERLPRPASEPTRFCLPAQGKVYDLEAMAQDLSERFFEGQFPKVPVFWSAKKAKRYWGKYYPDPARIVINSRLDRPKVPRYVVEAVLYHEMLHHAIGVRTVCGRKRAHTHEFRRAERAFPHHSQADDFLMQMR